MTSISAAIVTLMILMASYEVSNGQDAHFSQPYAAPLKLNPAIIGANTDFRTIINYRTQWNGIVAKEYQTYKVTFLYPIIMEGDNLGLGLSVNNDRAGAFQTTDVSLAVAYSKGLSQDHHLSLALTGGYILKSLDQAKLTFEEQYVLGQYSSSNPTGEEDNLSYKASYPDLGAGLMWYYNPPEDFNKVNAFAGVAGYHLNAPNESFINSAEGKLPRKISYLIGVKFNGISDFDVATTIRASTQQGADEIATGLYIDYHLGETSKVGIGSWFKIKQGVTFIVGFSHANFTIGYSYDLGTSALTTLTKGANAHEVTLSFKLDLGKNGKLGPYPFSEF